MHIKRHLVISHSNNPYLNLGLENDLMMNLKGDESILFLYTNSPCVVMGRFQNPWIECDLKKMKVDGVKLVRRQSGGGCVYHDHGNLNFSFINWKDNHNKADNQEFLINFFNTHNIPIEKNERDDLVIRKDDKTYKISGSAFKQKRDRAFHHGTLLFDTDLELLNGYLLAGTDHTQHFESKSTKSVRSVVTNIGDFISKNLFIESLEASQLISKVSIFTEDAIKRIPTIIEYSNSILDHTWLWGETPLFQSQLTLGHGILSITLKKAKIIEFFLESELIHKSLTTQLSSSIIGLNYCYKEILNCFEELDGSSVYVEEFKSCLEQICAQLFISELRK